MTDQELKDLVARFAEESEKVKKAQQQTEKEMRRTLKTLGELGNARGQMTEGLVYPSIAKILRQRFKTDRTYAVEMSS